jgi:hypothetical protein
MKTVRVHKNDGIKVDYTGVEEFSFGRSFFFMRLVGGVTISFPSEDISKVERYLEKHGWVESLKPKK